MSVSVICATIVQIQYQIVYFLITTQIIVHSSLHCYLYSSNTHVFVFYVNQLDPLFSIMYVILVQVDKIFVQWKVLGPAKRVDKTNYLIKSELTKSGLKSIRLYGASPVPQKRLTKSRI